MWIIAGLGNPGNKYRETRHNLGFLAVEKLLPSPGEWREQGKALTARTEIAGEQVLLVKPQTFMNLSVQGIAPLLTFHKVPLQKLLVLVDDVNLPCGKLRLRPHGSHGGQNGLRSIVELWGVEFPRLRLGVGAPPPGWDMANWVLSRFTPEDAILCQEALQKVPALVECLIRQGMEISQAGYN